MPASSTSREAYSRHVIAGRASSQQARILSFVRWAGNAVSRADIEHAFNAWLSPGGTWDGGARIPLGSICPRIHALIGAGLVRRLNMPGRNERTGHMVQLLEGVEPAPVQRTFEDFARLLDHEVSHGR